MDHSRIGLVLNMRGWERCVARPAATRPMSWSAPPTASASANQGATVAQQVDALAAIVERQAVERRPADHRHHLGGASAARSTARCSKTRWWPSLKDAADDGGEPRSPWPTPSAVRRSLDRAAGRIEAVRAAAPDMLACACISTTPATPAWPTPSPASRPGSISWTPRSAAWAAARSRRTPPATSAPRTWSTCWSGPASRPATTCGPDRDPAATSASAWARALRRSSHGPGGRVSDWSPC